MKSLIEKLSTKKTVTAPHADRLKAIAKLDSDLDNAIGDAMTAGVAIHTVVELLERKGNAARHRMAAGLVFSVAVARPS